MKEIVEAFLYAATLQHWNMIGCFTQSPCLTAARKVILAYEEEHGRVS